MVGAEQAIKRRRSDRNMVVGDLNRVKASGEAREDRTGKEVISAAYDSYKAFQVKMARTFVLAARNEWFRERYVPEIREPLRQH